MPPPANDSDDSDTEPSLPEIPQRAPVFAPANDSDSDTESSLPEIPAKAPPVQLNGSSKRKAKDKAEAPTNKKKREEVEESDERDVEAHEDQDEEDEEEEELFEVEAIEAHKFQKGKLFFRVKWLHYEEEADKTWEPEDNMIESAQEVLDEYYESIGGKPVPPGNRKKTPSKPAPIANKANKRQKREDPEDINDWQPTGPNWDDDVEEVISVDKSPHGDGLTFAVLFKNGARRDIAQNRAHLRIPQSLIKFYESKLVFT